MAIRINSCGHPERRHAGRGMCGPCYYGKNGPGHAAWLRYQHSAKGKATRSAFAKTYQSEGRRKPNRIRLRYGVTEEQYQSLLAIQDGVCAICRDMCSTGRRLSIDHGHRSDCNWRERGETDNHCSCPIRGLLCQRCNATLGAIERERDKMKNPPTAAILYLKRVS